MAYRIKLLCETLLSTQNALIFKISDAVSLTPIVCFLISDGGILTFVFIVVEYLFKIIIANVQLLIVTLKDTFNMSFNEIIRVNNQHINCLNVFLKDQFN